MSELEGKNIEEVIAAGVSKLASVPSGGGGGGGGGAAAGGGGGGGAAGLQNFTCAHAYDRCCSEAALMSAELGQLIRLTVQQYHSNGYT